MKYFISAILLIIGISCSTTNKENNTTYFGGKILNPKTTFVIFLKDGAVIDTLLLDKNNRFMGQYASLKEGLYTFKHGNEFQYIYLEPADSVLVRLNTWGFDESLVFSGKGSAKNEFLINLFLQNEKEEKQMHRYFNLKEQGFQKKIDSLTKERVLIYTAFLDTEIQISEGFEKLTNTAIHFPLYRLKEVYPYYHKKAHKLPKFPVISNNFYNFRNDISLNEEDLVSFYPYQNYVLSYLYNLNFDLKEKGSSKDSITQSLLKSIVKNIQLEDFKNTLLKRIVVNDFLKSESTCAINEKTLQIFLENCSNANYKNQVKNLVNDSKVVENNKALNNFEILLYNNTISTIKEAIKNKNTAIYFWSSAYMSPEYLISRINYLEKNYPTILFIGINMRTENSTIITEPNFKKLDSSKQFKLTAKSYANKFLTSNYPRVILVNRNGIVTNGFTYLSSKKFHSELNKLQKN